MDIQEVSRLSGTIKANIETNIVGKSDLIDLVLAALLAKGHVLLEDVPGTGKTVLAKSLAGSIEMDFKRIQFTPDLLPSDLIGINYYNQKEGEFVFRKGALFTNVLLADEINRATPRTQSALLEAMEEKQITVDGKTYTLQAPFFVIATQNPVETQGTFPLPEAQLDRFLVQLSMGYTDKEEMLTILSRFSSGRQPGKVSPVVTRQQLLDMQEAVETVRVHPDVAAYSVDLVEKTRHLDQVVLGVSPRGNLALIRAAKALAAVKGRDYVIPDDIKALALPVLGHRMILRGSQRQRSSQIEELISGILEETPVPTEDWKKQKEE
ncbi:MAG TPA: magnesium chelatase [Lachnospiraceae bacterium]|jgi:MoxR-like ATPase|nr:magnesium chelatase [Lachnospiraceae bacterium]